MLENYKPSTVFPSLKGKSAPEPTHGTRDTGKMGMIQWARFAGRNVITSVDTKHICHVNIENNVSE